MATEAPRREDVEACLARTTSGGPIWQEPRCITRSPGLVVVVATRSGNAWPFHRAGRDRADAQPGVAGA